MKRFVTPLAIAIAVILLVALSAGAATNLTDLIVTGSVTAGSAVVTGGVTAGSVDSTGAVQAGTFVKSVVATPVAVTFGSTITLAGGLQPITASGQITNAIIGVPASGISGCLVNTSANAITVKDTGTAILSGDQTLGQGDTICGFSNGTNFY